MLGVFQLRRAVLHSPDCLEKNLNTQYTVVLSNKFLDASGQLLVLIFLSWPFVVTHNKSGSAVDSRALNTDTHMVRFFIGLGPKNSAFWKSSILI